MEKISNKERFLPLKMLAEKWLYDYFDNEKFYLDTLIPMIISGDFSKVTAAEYRILTKIRDNFSKNEWKNLKSLFLGAINSIKKETHNKTMRARALEYISKNDFEGYEKLFCKNKNVLLNTEKIFETELNKFTKTLRENIVKLSYINFQEALSYFYKEAKKLPANKKEEIGLFLEDVEDLINLLKSYNFKEADTFFYKKKIITKNEYENLKKEYVLKYFNGENIDEDKALAISSISPNVLLRARAGSGKTSTLCLKTMFLMEKYNVKPDEILILAFNKEAKIKIKRDLFEKYGLKNYLNNEISLNFDNVKTFHSFAKSINNEKKIAEDRKRKEIILKSIENVLECDKNKKNFYEFYKKSLIVPFKKGCSIEQKSYVEFKKGLSQVTLKGETVKSLGEKYIADFLFEHGIEYEYEKAVIFSKEDKEALNIDDDWNVFKPDFYIQYDNKEFYLEHWALDEDVLAPNCFAGKGVIDNPSKYVRNMFIKRRYFKKKNIPLIETKAKNSQIRENFEIILKETLEKFGINPVKQEYEKLFLNVKELNIKSFYKTIESFISTVKKSKFDSFFIERKLNDINLSERTRIFLNLAYQIYIDYQKSLKKENLCDFDDLIINASNKVMSTKGEAEFNISENRKKKVKNLKYILIDEYQDFSKLFFDLICALKCYNPSLKIFATGDDWQAINGFAGSNLYYFNNFKQIFNNSEIYNLANNYRSYKNIIDVSNTLMSLNGIPAKPFKDEDGEVWKVNIDKTFINKENNSDLIYSFKRDFGKIKAKYLKTVHRIIRLHPDKNFLILSRLNKISGSNLELEFANKLLRMNTVDNSKVKFMTIHKSKGLEADIVIILRTINGVIPFVHPDYEIMTALNRTHKDILDEEKRLFYVALTRAKEKVFILTEGRLESVYLKSLNLKEINFKHLNFDSF